MQNHSKGIGMGNKKKQLSDEALLIAYRIREARVKKYATVTDAAAAFPAERMLWGNWEKARVKPQKATMEKLASFLGVSVGYFSGEPDNWEEEKAKFLAELTNRTRAKTKKEYYSSFKASLPPVSNTQQNAGKKLDDIEPLAVFLQITRLITDAQTNLHDGKISQEAYDMHMRTIADMVKVSMLARK